MKRKLCFMLVIAVLLSLMAGTAFAAANIGGGNAQPTDPGTGYPQYSDEYYDLYGGASNNSTVTLEIVGDMGLRVFVTETDGVTPIEGATVSIVTLSSGVLLAAITDANGMAFVELPRPGLDPDDPNGVIKPEQYEFTVEKEGYMPSEKILVDFDGHTIEKHVMLERAAREVTLLVTDPSGMPVSDADVVLNNYSTSEPTGSGVTGADGTLKVTLPIAVHRIVVSHKDFAIYSGRIECKPDTNSIEIRLSYEKYNVRLFLKNAVTGEPVPNMPVLIAELMQSLTSGADGKVAIPNGGLTPGEYRYSIKPPDGTYKSKTGKFKVIKSSDLQEFEIELIPVAQNIVPSIVENIVPPGTNETDTPQSLTATRSMNKKIDVESCVYDAEGNCIEGASLNLKPADMTLISDEKGQAVFHETEIGEHTIVAQKDGKTDSVDFELIMGDKPDLIIGEDTPRVVVTEDMDTVTLYLELNENGLRIAGITKDSYQDLELKTNTVPAPYAQSVSITQDDASTEKAPQLDQNSLWWLLLLLIIILTICIIAAYVNRKKEEEAQMKNSLPLLK